MFLKMTNTMKLHQIVYLSSKTSSLVCIINYFETASTTKTHQNTKFLILVWVFLRNITVNSWVTTCFHTINITTTSGVYRNNHDGAHCFFYLMLTGQRRDNGMVNTLRPRQHGRHFADDTFKRIFLNENVIISIKISLMFVPKGPINNIPALVQIMAWRRPGDKPLSEAMMVSLLTHICVTWPQWVKPQKMVKRPRRRISMIRLLIVTEI